MGITQWFIDHADDLPLVAMMLFIGISVLVIIYTATDRRRAHAARMSAMALDDQGQPHDH